MKWFLAFFLVFLVAASGRADETSYRVGADDKLRVTIFGEPDLSGEFSVDGAGNLSLPLVGQVPVRGLTVSEVENRLVERYRHGFLNEPRVAIDVLTYRPFYVLGEVNIPGRYPYANGMSVLNAVAMGGGYTYRANKDAIKIRRETAAGTTVLKGTPDSPVMPGDVIEIGERVF
jgi:protein involved in polysaccharide export with SLBB domain